MRARPDPWTLEVRAGRTVAPDGTGIFYEVLGRGPRTLLLANGLGGRLYAWEPLLAACRDDYRIVTWDYRGLFASDSPESLRRLSVPHHVDDALAVMRAEGVARAVVLGWSMGVQVGLDLAASHPERVAGLVLLNGTYGHVLTLAFQPLLSAPWLPHRLHAVVEWLRRHPDWSAVLARLCQAVELPTVLLLQLTAGRRAFALRPVLRRYFADVLGPSFPNYLRLFQELDAHSAYHVLPEIAAPALVISGALDLLTPARHSAEIARRLPRAKRMALRRASHFALLERQDVVVPAIVRFLAERAEW